MFGHSSSLRMGVALMLVGVVSFTGWYGCSPADDTGGGDAASGPVLPTVDDLAALAAGLGFTDVQAGGEDTAGNTLAVVYTPAETEPEEVAVLMMSNGVGTVARAVGSPGSITAWELYYSPTAPMVTLWSDAATLGDGTVITYTEDDSTTEDETDGDAPSTLLATLTVTGETTVDLAADAARSLSCIASGGTPPYTVGLQHESGTELARFEQTQLSNRVDATVEFADPAGTHGFLCVVVDSDATTASDRVDIEATGETAAASTTDADSDAARAQTEGSLACADDGRSVARAAEVLANALFSCAASAFDSEDATREGFTQRFGECITAFPAATAYAALDDLTAALITCCPPSLTFGEYTSCLNVGETTAFTAVVEASNDGCPWDAVHFVVNPSPTILTGEFVAGASSGSPPRSEGDLTLVALARGTVDLEYQVWVPFAGDAEPHVRSTIRINVAECDTCQTLDRELCACVGEPCAADSPDDQEPDDGSTPDDGSQDDGSQDDDQDEGQLDGAWVQVGSHIRWTFTDEHLISIDLVPEHDNGMSCSYSARGDGESTLVRETPSNEGETFNCNTSVTVIRTGSTGSISGYESFTIDFEIDGDAMTFFGPDGTTLSSWERE